MIASHGDRHNVIVCRRPGARVTWRPPEPTDQTGHDMMYLGRALATALELLGDCEPLTFVLTWDLHDLPESGSRVVAIVQGDEDARIPRWSNDVLVTFKCYGTRPPWMPLPPGPGMLEFLELAHYVRRCIRWVPGATRRTWRAGRPWRPRQPIIPIPLGYYNQDDRPMIPFDQRRFSVSFAGSGLEPARDRGLRARIGTPKERARVQMRDALANLMEAFPEEPIATVSQPLFPELQPGRDRAARELTGSYSELLSQTRLCLVPRGNSPETFRFFEALRAGCVVVCEALPDHWFYRGAPVVRVRKWSELGSVLLPLLRNPAAIAERQRSSVRWWNSRCSEDALGRLMAERIRLQLQSRGVGAERETSCRD